MQKLSMRRCNSRYMHQFWRKHPRVNSNYRVFICFKNFLLFYSLLELMIITMLLSRPGHESWLKISWPSNNQPDLAILKYGTCLSLAYLGEIWPLLVLDNWKVITNFLVKAVTLCFSQVSPPLSKIPVIKNQKWSYFS